MTHRSGLWFTISAMIGLFLWTAASPWIETHFTSGSVLFRPSPIKDVERSIHNLDSWFAEHWATAGIRSADAADDLQVLRRIHLALTGAIPSLSDIRLFQSLRKTDRLRDWVLRLLCEERSNHWLAERLATAYVGERPNDPPWYRREELVLWLGRELQRGTSYDSIVRQMVTAKGTPTSDGYGNFLTAEIASDDHPADRLVARSIRAFLGQQMDCAECHNHPVDRWTQNDFRGMAAFFVQVRMGELGIRDDLGRRYQAEDRNTLEQITVEPQVPFHPEWLGEGTSRERFAQWLTHPKNRRLWRAIANRAWGLIFGRPLILPVDSIPDPPASSTDSDDLSSLLDVLADDLRDHGGDLRRLLAIICLSRPFRLSSIHSCAMDAPSSELLVENWAQFPLVALLPQQLGLSYRQVTSSVLLEPVKGTFALIERHKWMLKFLEKVGSVGAHEFDERTDSVPSSVQRLFGQYTREVSRVDMRNLAGRITLFAPDSAACVETCYLVCLTRLPDESEREHFESLIKESKGTSRSEAIEDMLWTLLNSPEFNWNH